MRLSSGAVERIEGLSMLEHGPDDGHTASCEGDESLGVSLPFAPLSIAVGFRGQVLGGDRAE